MKILVPVDGSAPAHRALGHALMLARGRDDASLVLVNVQSPETLDVSEVSDVMSVTGDHKRAVERSHEALREAAALCRAEGVVFEIRAELGPVAETIDRVARRLGVDQIVMGTRGLGPVRRLLLGSVATKVVRLAKVPVTLVK